MSVILTKFTEKHLKSKDANPCHCSAVMSFWEVFLCAGSKGGNYMTQNQVAWLANREQQRANLAKERETYRHNRAMEKAEMYGKDTERLKHEETLRHNLEDERLKQWEANVQTSNAVEKWWSGVTGFLVDASNAGANVLKAFLS